jgi:hypothetical protein
MADLTFQRCLNHSAREAVARCPECGQYFCRECVTEHQDRVICAGCLQKLGRGSAGGRVRFQRVLVAGGCLAGVLTAWLCFYAVGRGLLAIPDSFHAGTLWQDRNMDEP